MLSYSKIYSCMIISVKLLESGPKKWDLGSNTLTGVNSALVVVKALAMGIFLFICIYLIIPAHREIFIYCFHCIEGKKKKKQPTFPLEWGQGLSENVAEINDLRKIPGFLIKLCALRSPDLARQGTTNNEVLLIFF